MSTGRIQFAEQDGTFVLKFVGEVRLTLCSALDATIERIFTARNFTAIVIDLTETRSIDSTTLGLLARMEATASSTGMGVNGEVGLLGSCWRAFNTISCCGKRAMSKIWVQRKLKKPLRMTKHVWSCVSWRATASIANVPEPGTMATASAL